MPRYSDTTYPGSPATPMRQSPRLNSRLPPLVHRSSSSLPCRMALLSRDKLQREASARSPDIRRCLAHDRVLRRSIQIAQADVKKAITALRVDDSDGEEEFDAGSETPPVAILRDQIASAVKSIVRRRSPERSSEKSRPRADLAGVSSHSSKSSSSSITVSKAPALSSKRSRYAARLGFGRRLCSPSPALQPMVG